MMKNVCPPSADGKVSPSADAPAAMMLRTVDGWELCSRDGASWWVRDLDLAARAGLAKPHDVRPTIRGLLADLAKNQDSAAAGILISAEKILVAMPGGRGHREVTEYLLNREAALHVLLRLRTARAVALQIELVSVYVKVLDGDLTGEELRALRERDATHSAEMALMKTQIAEVKNMLLLGSATAAPRDVGRVKSWRSLVAQAWFDAGRAPSVASARRSIQNAIEAMIGGPLRDELLSPNVVGRVIGYLEREAKTSQRMIKRRSQVTFPGLENVIPLKRRKPRAV